MNSFSHFGFWFFVSAATSAGLVYYLIGAVKYNNSTHPLLVDEWQNSFLCLRCDTIFRIGS